MQKSKKILAIIGVICLVLLYTSTLIFAFIDTTTSLIYLKTSIGATIFFPVILYVMSMLYKLGKNDTQEFQQMDETDEADEAEHEK